MIYSAQPGPGYQELFASFQGCLMRNDMTVISLNYNIPHTFEQNCFSLTVGRGCGTFLHYMDSIERSVNENIDLC